MAPGHDGAAGGSGPRELDQRNGSARGDGDRDRHALALEDALARDLVADPMIERGDPERERHEGQKQRECGHEELRAPGQDGERQRAACHRQLMDKPSGVTRAVTGKRSFMRRASFAQALHQVA